jgi:cysteine desulfurase family protein (TIGR01976 family)
MTEPSGLDMPRIRSQFPALSRVVGQRTAIFLDGPGGTQVPTCVTDAMVAYLQHNNANVGGLFATSRETTELVDLARREAALFLGARAAEEVIFGANMTSMTFALSRALARSWSAGDEIIVSTLDHDANVAPWLLAAEDRGAVVKRLRCQAPEWALRVENLAPLLNPKTRLLAITAASNAIGTMVDLRPLIDAAHAVGALVFVDAVHYAPHGLIDAAGWNCDFLACSAYKFCGPHLGMLAPRHAVWQEGASRSAQRV